jgi:5'-3' exonuclease
MKIALVDFSHMLVVNFKARANDGGPNYAAEATMTELAGLRQHFDRIVVCLDGPPYFRKEKYPAYKAGREREPELVRLWKLCVDKVEREYQIAKAATFEADDVCATLAVAYSDMGHTVEIVGADKDALQVIRDQGFRKRGPDGPETEYGAISVRVLGHGGVADEIRGSEYVRKKYDVEPKDFALALAIMGDKGDNIPGIPSLGEKKAAALIKQFRDIKGMRLGLARAVDDSIESGKELPAFWKAFAKFNARQMTENGKSIAEIDMGPGKPKVPALGLELMLELTTLRTDVPLDAAALLVQKQRVAAPVPESMRSDADDSIDAPDEHLDRIERDLADEQADWDSIAADVAAKEAAELAALSANDDGGKALADALGLKPPGTIVPPAVTAPATELPSDSPFKRRAGAEFTRRAQKSCDLHQDCDKAEAFEMAEAKKRGHTWKTDVKHDYTSHDAQVYANVKPSETAIRAEQRKMREEQAANMATAKVAQTEAETRRKSEPPPAANTTVVAARSSAVTSPSAADSPASASDPAAKSAAAHVAAATETKTNGASQVVPATQGPAKQASTEALTRPPPPTWDLGLQPITIGQAIDASKILWEGGLFRQFGSMQGVFSIVTLGREIGLGMMASLRGFHNIQDKPFPAWDMLLSLAKSDPDCKWIAVAEMNNDRCVVKAESRTMPGLLQHEYTRQLAEQAGYFTGKNAHNWKTKTRNMLRARAVSEAVHMWFPSKTYGMNPAETAGDDE